MNTVNHATTVQDKPTQAEKSAESAPVDGAVAITPDAIQGLGLPFAEIKRDLYSKYRNKRAPKIWKTIEEKANEFSNMLTYCRCKYQEQKIMHPELAETLDLFDTAAWVVGEELFAVSAMAAFFVDAEERRPKSADELREMFDAAFWGKGVAAFNTMGQEIFADTESNG